jgi:hypothetical protein
MHAPTLIALALATVGYAAVDEPCYGADSQQGKPTMSLKH